MKYHFKIIDTRYPDQLICSSRMYMTIKDGNEYDFQGYDNPQEAYEYANDEIERNKWEKLYTRINITSTNV